MLLHSLPLQKCLAHFRPENYAGKTACHFLPFFTELKDLKNGSYRSLKGKGGIFYLFVIKLVDVSRRVQQESYCFSIA